MTINEEEKLEELARALYEGGRIPPNIPWERLATAMRRQWIERAREKMNNAQSD